MVLKFLQQDFCHPLTALCCPCTHTWCVTIEKSSTFANMRDTCSSQHVYQWKSYMFTTVAARNFANMIDTRHSWGRKQLDVCVPCSWVTCLHVYYDSSLNSANMRERVRKQCDLYVPARLKPIVLQLPALTLTSSWANTHFVSVYYESSSTLANLRVLGRLIRLFGLLAVYYSFTVLQLLTMHPSCIRDGSSPNSCRGYVYPRH